MILRIRHRWWSPAARRCVRWVSGTMIFLSLIGLITVLVVHSGWEGFPDHDHPPPLLVSSEHVHPEGSYTTMIVIAVFCLATLIGMLWIMVSSFVKMMWFLGDWLINEHSLCVPEHLHNRPYRCGFILISGIYFLLWGVGFVSCMISGILIDYFSFLEAYLPSRDTPFFITGLMMIFCAYILRFHIRFFGGIVERRLLGTPRPPTAHERLHAMHF